MTDTFDALRYVAGYPDLIAAFGTNENAARAHYEAIGRSEGRDPFKFNIFAYAAANTDLITAFGGNHRAFSLHYIQYGFGERRAVTFDALTYGASHADLIQTFGANAELLTQHYVQYGFAEQRALSFNALAYGASHADLIQAYGANAEALKQHYIRYGFAEQRAITFDALAYGASHVDLIKAFGDNASALARHYIQNGLVEGRGVTFNAAAYAAANPDLEAQFAVDGAALTLHFIRTGFAEGRVSATILGTQNADILHGTEGRDVVAGRAGDDVFVGSAGGDRYFGGIGVDTLDYSAFTAALTIDRSVAGDTVARYGLASDSLVSIERLILGAGDDRITLDGSRDIVVGGAGADQILGRGGGDELYGGAGDDLLSSFVLGEPVPEGIDQLFGEDGNDTLILGVRGGLAFGGQGSDYFILRDLAGSASATLHGGSGIDSVSSSMIGNLLVAADGSVLLSDRATGTVRALVTDIEYWSNMPMTTWGIADGVVRITGEGGRAFYFNGRGNHEIRGAFLVTDPVNFTGFQLSHGAQDIDATFLGGGRLSFSTSEGSTRAIIRGDANVEFDISSNSNVVLGDGSDRFVVRAGTSTLDGGGGIDTLWILTAAPVVIDLVRGTAIDTQGISVSFARIESAIAGDGDDVIIGNDEANILRGLGGNDRIYGGGTGTDGRFDILIGREGNDLLVGGAGYDSLRGELGNDTLIDRANGSFSGDEGDDLIVVLLDDPATSAGQVAYVNSDSGADTIIISALVGTFGDIRLTNFSQFEGDVIDLSNLRDSGGNVIDIADLIAAATATPEGLRVQLDAFRSTSGNILSGQILFAGLDEATDLNAAMFKFENGMNWQSLVPSDWLL